MDYILQLIEQYRYLILFPLAAFEGPIVALVAGFAVHMGFLSFIPSYMVLILGDLIPDVIYYYIGRFGNTTKIVEKYRTKSGGIISNNFNVMERLWSTHPRKTMFLSKLAYGLSTPFLISAGLVKMPLKQFLSYTIPISLLQYMVILTIGYFLGKSYEVAAKYIKYGGYLFAALLVVFIIGYVFAFRYARKEIRKLEKEI